MRKTDLRLSELPSDKGVCNATEFTKILDNLRVGLLSIGSPNPTPSSLSPFLLNIDFGNQPAHNKMISGFQALRQVTVLVEGL
ncbi:hypothetical protein PoB_000634100 [Plakobranchus ocellatus]|uniref:Uncharacterized protein n=1 Tax=Plakobranchus ocellatus TaxID=259542 RepID=A0AAV3XY05_9GAST|nr:hypothetical protein PoB_000634100 [Plakobranchus ocellatus]